jgi:AcrR family transcriptional regulator
MSQSETTKEKIINAAIKIFANKGFWQTKISDIVKEAGVAQGTFYIYFKSKNDCFKLILSMLHNETISILNDKFSQGFILSEIIIVFIKRIYKYKKISKVFLFEAISSGNEFQELYFNFKKNFKNFFKSYYRKELKNSNQIEVKSSILSGFLKEIIEQDILYENKKIDSVINKIKDAINILNGKK